jgi:lantibiotic modifying enzyme
MVGNSDYLHERIASGTADQSPEGLESDFIAWREVLNLSGEQIFDRRLASLGLDENQARRLAQRIDRNPDCDTPDWSRILVAALGSPDPDSSFFDHDQPFAKIWAPISGYAAKQLTIRHRHLVSDRALADTSRFLHAEISKIAAEPTYLVFDNFRSQGKTFEEFVDGQRRNHGEDIFSRYPVLARCIGELIRDWIKTTNLFFHRLATDAGLLSTEFGIADLCLTSLAMGLSDRHAGGYQVIRADFGDQRILYKPKEMSLEFLVPKINQWLSAEGFPTPFRFPYSIDCGGYGWAEWIDQKPCHSDEEVKRYYWQSGALLCLSHLLNAKDLLFENIVACGTDPVPIDLETFLQPEARTFDRIGQPLEGDHPAYKWKGSVIDIALLPFWQFSSSHPMCDLSGLGCKNENLPPCQEIEWLSINSTEMKRATRLVRTYRTRNEVFYLGKVQNAENFILEIQSGFAAFHRFVTNRKESLVDFLSQWSGAK